MSKRPRSVTIICWILIAFGGLFLLAIVRPHDAAAAQHFADLKAQRPFLWMLFYAGPIILMICGVFMLLGFGWARWLLHAWFGHNIIMNTIHSPRQLWGSVILFGVAVFYLYHPQASAFFHARNTRITPEPLPTASERPQDTPE